MICTISFVLPAAVVAVALTGSAGFSGSLARVGRWTTASRLPTTRKPAVRASRRREGQPRTGAWAIVISPIRPDVVSVRECEAISGEGAFPARRADTVNVKGNLGRCQTQFPPARARLAAEVKRNAPSL